jgi:hypothetical protein
MTVCEKLEEIVYYLNWKSGKISNSLCSFRFRPRKTSSAELKDTTQMGKIYAGHSHALESPQHKLFRKRIK